MNRFSNKGTDVFIFILKIETFLMKQGKKIRRKQVPQNLNSFQILAEFKGFIDCGKIYPAILRQNSDDKFDKFVSFTILKKKENYRFKL